MRSFSARFLKDIRFQASTTCYLSQCAEARGMQELWKRVKPELLKKLKESAIVQSTESSNRIEGVEVAKDRLIPLVLGKAKPKDRSEEEVAGYRKALQFIHENFASLEISPETIAKLHELAQGGMISDAGKWKTRDNDIIEINAEGDRSIRFRPVAAAETKKAIEQLCLGYQEVSQNSQLPELISISNFIFDFLCIHPFRDGNGRVSRLLTLLLLYQNQFEIGRFISLERIVENTKEDYYRVLKESSQEWHQSKHDLMPWWNYFLSVLKSAYQELKERVELSSDGDNQSSLLRQSIEAMPSSFQISDIQKLHPEAGRDLIKKVLARLQDDKKIVLQGKGRGAMWKMKRRFPL